MCLYASSITLAHMQQTLYQPSTVGPVQELIQHSNSTSMATRHLCEFAAVVALSCATWSCICERLGAPLGHAQQHKQND